MDFDSSSATQVTGALQDADLDTLLNTHFAGRVVRKDLTQRVKEGANVPCMCWSICWVCTAPLMMRR